MAGEYLVGVDIGTSGSKGVLVDRDGRVLAQRFLEHGVTSPKPGWSQQDADGVWWSDLCAVVRHLLSASGIDPRRVCAVGVSAITPDMLPLDARGSPLYAGLLYSDGRAREQVREIVTQLGQQRIFEVTGRAVGPDSVAAKMLWLRQHEPQVWARTCKVVTASTYLVYRLTGSFVVDYAQATGYAPLFSLHRRAWEIDYCRELELDMALLPKVRWATDVAGAVTAAAARETGLAEGTPVITGTGDSYAEVISVGAVGEGEASLIYGSTMTLLGMTRTPATHPKISYGMAAVPEMYRVSMAMSTSAALTRWFRDNFGQVEVEAETRLGLSAYHLLSEEAGSIPPGSEGLLVLPYFAGERAPIYDAAARGTMIGLTLSHTRKHIYRALLEGVAFGLRHGMEDLQAANVRLQRIVATGGGTRSRVWLQIVSDVIGQDQILVRAAHGAPYGDAFLAGLGVGLFHDLTPLRETWVQTAEVVRHDAQRKRRYDPYYEIYRGLYAKLKDDMHALAELAVAAP